MLKNCKTSIAEITDGTSNTIAFAEVAGRDPRYLAAGSYIDSGYNTAYGWTTDLQRPVGHRRPAPPDLALGRSGQRDRRLGPDQQPVPPDVRHDPVRDLGCRLRRRGQR